MSVMYMQVQIKNPLSFILKGFSFELAEGFEPPTC